LKKFILLFVVLGINCYSQVYDKNDIAIYKSKVKLADSLKMSAKPIGDVIAEIGKSLVGSKYQALTLEKPEDEQLVINLSGFDCTTFMENCLVFARCIKENKTSFDDFKKELIKVRYRRGIIDQYPSRLHYFSDWIYDNCAKKVVKDITKVLGGDLIHFKVDYMSKNPEMYKHLAGNSKFISVIQKQEEEINARAYFYIPKNRVSRIEDKLQTGDIIAITTDIEGLDISHVGIAVKIKDRIHLMHAHITGGKVQISENPLSDYLAKIKKHTGIIVLRAVEP
jgi:hypothetical protein